MGDIKNVIGVRNFDGKEYVEFDSYLQLANEMQQENQKITAEIKCLMTKCETLKGQSFRDKDNLEKFQKDFARFDEKNKTLEAENKFLKEENSSLHKQIDELDRQNTNIQESHMKLYNDSKDEIRELKAQIQRLTGECGGRCACEQDQEDAVDFEALVYELQDRHQQDCIRINDLTTTISVLSDMYTNLRKNAGMG